MEDYVEIINGCETAVYEVCFSLIISRSERLLPSTFPPCLPSQRWRLPRLWMFFECLLEESWSAVRPLKTKCLCEVRKHQWWVQEFSGLWSQTRSWYGSDGASNQKTRILFVSFQGIVMKVSLKWTDRGKRAFMTMSSAGLFHVSRYAESHAQSLFQMWNERERALSKQNLRGDWNNGSQLLKGRAHFRLIR